MSRIEDMIGWFRRRGNQATLGEILRSGELWSHEMTARMSDARRRGIDFVCQQDRANPSNNLYRMMEQKG
jgi:hypothetical protein